MLWRIPEMFVEGKRLERTLWVLSTAGIQLTGPPQPVVNARVGPAGRLTAETSGRLVDMFREHLRKKKLTTVKPSEVGDFCESVGRSRKSYSIVLNELQADGTLKQNGKSARGSVYHVQKTKKGK